MRARDDVAARRRPGLVAGVWLVEAIAAWVLAAPWTSFVARTLGRHPDGDRAVFLQAGHVDLAALVLEHRAVLSALGSATIMGLAAFLLAGQLSLGALLGGLSDDGRYPLSSALARAGSLFARLVAIQGLVLVVLVVLGGFVLTGYYTLRLDQLRPGRDLAALVGLLIVSGGILALVSAAADLVRAVVARHDVGVIVAIARVARSPREVARLALVALPRWVASAGLVGFGAAFSSAASALVAVAVVHQLVALGRVGLRASVLARALRVADPLGEE